jgi:hypothetical protein
VAFSFSFYLDGEEVGTFVTAPPDWRIGDEFMSPTGRGGATSTSLRRGRGQLPGHQRGLWLYAPSGASLNTTS